MGSRQRAASELNRRLDKMWIDCVEPVEKSELHKVIGTWHATEGPNPVRVEPHEKLDEWWKDELK